MADPRVLFGERRLPEFLGGRRVDYYIPPEVRQGIGALLQGGDMLNPVSAYREYIRDVREGDVTGAATNLAGFVAPGAAGAIASRLGRAGAGAVEPYSDDAARALMEMLSPTGAPDDISRRQFMAGAGAAAVAPMLPAEELLELAGRGVARGGGRVVDEVLELLSRRNALYNAEQAEIDAVVEAAQKGTGEFSDLDDYDDFDFAIQRLTDRFRPLIKEADTAFFNRIAASDISQEELESLPDSTLYRLMSAIARESGDAVELADRRVLMDPRMALKLREWLSNSQDGVSQYDLYRRIQELLASRGPRFDELVE